MKVVWILLSLVYNCNALANSEDISGPRGGEVSMECNQNTGDAYVVYWYYGPLVNDHYVAVYITDGYIGGINQWENRAHIDPSTGDLTVNDTHVIDDGRYSCRYGHRVPPPTDGSSYNLFVTVLPTTPLMSGLDYTDWVDIAQSYELTCVVDEVRPEARIYWVIDDVIQEGTITEVEPPTGDGIKKVTGTWIHTFNNDPAMQQLKCRVTDWDNMNKVLRDDPYKPVNVYYKPAMSVKLADEKDPVEGSVYSLLCNMDDGRPAPGDYNYTWWKDDERLSESSSTLTQTLDRTQHDGEYTCVASNMAGRGPSSAGFQLRVYYLASVLLAAFSSNPSVEGYETSAECSVLDGLPTQIQNITWRNGEAVVEVDGERIISEGGVLRITSAERGDEGYYTCDVTTSGGSKRSNPQQLVMCLMSQELPPSSTGLTVGALVGALFGGMVLGGVITALSILIILKQRTSTQAPQKHEKPCHGYSNEGMDNPETQEEKKTDIHAVTEHADISTEPSLYYNMNQLDNNPYDELTPQLAPASTMYDKINLADTEYDNVEDS